MTSVMGITWAPEQMPPSFPWWLDQLWIKYSQVTRQCPLSEAEAFLLRPLWEKPQSPHPGDCKAPLCPQPLCCGERSLLFNKKGSCAHLLHFGPIPRPSMATWAFNTRQRQKASCLPSCWLQLPSQLLVAGKEGVATDLVGQ